MAYEVKDNTGSLFRNNRKETEKHPDYTGSARIDGHDLWMSAWLKESKDGTKYFSFSFKRKDGTAARPEADKVAEFKAEAKRVFSDAPLDDDIPF